MLVKGATGGNSLRGNNQLRYTHTINDTAHPTFGVVRVNIYKDCPEMHTV